MSATAIKGKDWLFNVLWSGCANKLCPKCSINIPLTCLFNKGSPSKFLLTDIKSGYIKRIFPDDISDERLGMERGFRGEFMKPLRVLRELLLEYSSTYKFDQAQRNEDSKFICRVYYSDGQEEDMTLKSLDVLLRNSTWRIQVLMIQGYIPAKSFQTGNYSNTPQVRSKLDDSNNELADRFISGIAKFTEKIYSLHKGEGSDETSSSLTLQKLDKPISLQVIRMKGNFALDPNDQVIFLCSENTTVEIQNGRKEVEEYMEHEKNARVASAAKAVSGELYELLVHARNRGLTTEAAFSHFDTSNSGYFDTDMLMDGLARLGIGVTLQVAEGLMQIIGGIGSSFISKSDFLQFLQAPPDLELLDETDLIKKKGKPQKNNTVENRNTSTITRALLNGIDKSDESIRSPGKKLKKTSKEKKKTTVKQLLPPLKDLKAMEKVAHFLDIAASQKHSWEHSELQDDDGEGSAPPLQEEKPVDKPLPLPASAYATSGRPLINRSDSGTGFYASDPLAPWAKKRSQRALKELRTAATGKAKRQRGEAESLADESKPLDESFFNEEIGKRNKVEKEPSSKILSTNVEPLTLQGIVNGLTAITESKSCQDELLHVDHGVIMTYRVVEGAGRAYDAKKSHQQVDSLRYKSKLEVIEAKMNHSMTNNKGVSSGDGLSSGESKLSESQQIPGVEERQCFTLVVLPDLFTTLETLQTQFAPLLKKYPYSALVLVGLPGAPNTTWPSDWILNSDLHARSLGKLMLYLVEQKRIHISDADIPTGNGSIYFVSLGFSSHSLTRFLTLHLSDIPAIKLRTRAMVMVNGLLRFNKKFKQTCKELRQAMLTANAYEINELITSLHFWGDYMTQNGREKCLEKFWSTRRDLWKFENKDKSHSGTGLQGVLEQLKGILISPDDFDGAMILSNTEIPLLVVQSTEDVFVDPRNAVYFKADQLPPERHLVKDISDSLDQSAVHVNWLKSGHEVSQERHSYLLGFLSQLVQLGGVQPKLVEESVESTEGKNGGSVEDEVFDVLELASRRSFRATPEPGKALPDTSTVLGVDSIAEGDLEDLEQDDSSSEGLVSEAATPGLTEQQIKEAEEHAAHQEHLAAEKRRREQMAEEREKREAVMARQNQLDYWYQWEENEVGRKNAEWELVKMEKEDKRSRFAAEYERECEIDALSKKMAKLKAEELQKRRREEAVRKSEDQIARQRAGRMEERRRRAKAMAEKIRAEELILAGLQDGRYEMPKDVGAVHRVIEASNQIIKDLMLCKQKLVESMKRQIIVQEKMEAFRKQVASTENEERRLRRAIRLIEINPSVVGDDINAEVQLIELRNSLAAKQESLQEMVALAIQREDQLRAANRSVQDLKTNTHQLDVLMNQRIQELHRLEALLTQKLRDLKMKKEHLIVQKDRLRIQALSHQARIDLVTKELIRVRNHKQNLIDTDVWVPGVLQRCVTKELKKHLKRELKMAEDAMKKVQGELGTVREEVFDTTEVIALTKRDSIKVVVITKVLFRSYEKLHSVSASDMLKNLMQHQQRAEVTERRRTREGDVERLFALAGSNSLVDRVRLKDTDIRTIDERQFVGLDLVLNPDAYLHLTSAQAEQMQFDEDYHCGLAKGDLERILKLPEQIQLALPFLHSEEEVKAHRLLNTFFRGKDENYFRDCDYHTRPDGTKAKPRSTTMSLDDDNVTDIPPLLGEEEVKAAEIVHDILVKEVLRDRLRSSTPGEKLDDEEKIWILLDKILSPHVYDLAEIDDNCTKIKGIENSLSTSILNGLQQDKRPGSRAVVDGDQYKVAREKYDNGEDVFQRLQWKCPFNRQQLLGIMSAPGEEIDASGDDDKKLVRKLMEKYYVNDDDSTLGHRRLRSIERISRRVTKILESTERKADEELSANKAAMNRQASVANGLGLRTMSNLTVGSSADIEYVENEGINRVWGSWQQIHPASAGKESQAAFFRLSTFDASRDHPGNFAIHDETIEYTEEELSDGDDSVSMLSYGTAEDGSAISPRSTMRKRGMDTLTSVAGSVTSRTTRRTMLSSQEFQAEPDSNYFITDSIADLAQQESRHLRGKIVLLLRKDPLQLTTVTDASLQSRQSRSHYFSIPDRESVRALEITVSILFRGKFGERGYKLGRLAAGLFRIPAAAEMGEKRTHASTIPIPVGFAPYSMQCPNLPDKMGKITIIHRPKERPLKPGSFQIVIGVASDTQYSIEVSCRYGSTALNVVDEEITKAKQMQGRLPTCLKEIDSIEESIRLAERKLLVCEKMITEAELETERCAKGMRLVSERLERDEEELLMMEDERREHQRELAILEVEYAQWARTFGSRSQEKDDIKEGISMMNKFLRDRLEEKEKIKSELNDYRRDLPTCISILRTMAEAANVAASLNTTIQGVSEEEGAAATGDYGGIQVSTPAEDIRRQLKQYGFDSLMLEEQQWCLLDQALNVDKYEWLREHEEKEAMERQAAGKPPKEKKFNAALEPFRMSKVEIEYIMATPFSMLNRREVNVRKILTKFHDDKEHLKKTLSAVAYSFDPHLAERVRAKNPRAYTKEEQKWSTVDRVLHPEVWKFYVHKQDNFLDRHAKDAHQYEQSDAAESVKSRKTRKTNKSSKSKKLKDENSLTSDGEESSTLIESSPEKTPGRTTLLQIVDDAMAQKGAQLQTRKTYNGNADGQWECPFDRQNVIRIWKTPRHHLKTDDERTVFKLLHKYNGSYSSYHDTAMQAMKRQQNFVKPGSHVQWEKLGKLVSKDVDFRARQLQREIDRATYTQNEWIHSDVLHANDQKFPTPVLRMHLEEALDNLLMDQIRDRERAQRFKVDSSDSEDDKDKSAVEKLAETLGEEDELSVDLSDTAGSGDEEVFEKVKKRAKRREKRRKKLKKLSQEKEVLKARTTVKPKKTNASSLAEDILFLQLGTTGCLACRTKKCQWEPSQDVEALHKRRKELDVEVARVRADRQNKIFESNVCYSAKAGGNRVFRRQDLLEELYHEQRAIDLRVDLNNVDKELHDAYASRQEYFESVHIHGFAVLMWTNNARRALEARHNRLCALSVAEEVVDDMLSWMLEGWFFGERQSEYHVAGLVPSIKKDGFVRAGHDQMNTVKAVVEKMKKRVELKQQQIVTAEATRGRMIEKIHDIEMNSQYRLKVQKVARDNNSHEHLLNETEQTLKFGIFMVTLMYFRAMMFLKREQRSWNDEEDEIGVRGKGNKSKVMTDERMRMLDEENKALQRKKKVDLVLARCKVGEARRAEREAAERREAILRLQAVVRRQRLEAESILTIQKMYRGHIGRKVAKRWALKRAELGAMNALLNSTAITIQRYYRGYLGRLYAIRKRIEMAQFIALMRVQESASDEEIYWQTHPWSRFKRNRREWLEKKMEAYRSLHVLGGSRLTAEEQALMDGKTLAEIKREIEGWDDEEDPGLAMIEEEEGEESVDVSVDPSVADPSSTSQGNETSGKNLSSKLTET